VCVFFDVCFFLCLFAVFVCQAQAFPQAYRPRTLEERIRRSHQKQLDSQVELISRIRKGEHCKNVHEKVAQRLRQQQLEEVEAAKAAAKAAAEALAHSGSETARGSGSVLGAGDDSGANNNNGAMSARSRQSSRGGGRNSSNSGAITPMPTLPTLPSVAADGTASSNTSSKGGSSKEGSAGVGHMPPRSRSLRDKEFQLQRGNSAAAMKIEEGDESAVSFRVAPVTSSSGTGSGRVSAGAGAVTSSAKALGEGVASSGLGLAKGDSSSALLPAAPAPAPASLSRANSYLDSVHGDYFAASKSAGNSPVPSADPTAAAGGSGSGGRKSPLSSVSKDIRTAAGSSAPVGGSIVSAFAVANAGANAGSEGGEVATSASAPPSSSAASMAGGGRTENIVFSPIKLRTASLDDDGDSAAAAAAAAVVVATSSTAAVVAGGEGTMQEEAVNVVTVATVAITSATAATATTTTTTTSTDGAAAVAAEERVVTTASPHSSNISPLSPHQVTIITQTPSGHSLGSSAKDKDCNQNVTAAAALIDSPTSLNADVPAGPLTPTTISSVGAKSSTEPTTPAGGRKGQEIAQAIENDQVFEAQLKEMSLSRSQALLQGVSLLDAPDESSATQPTDEPPSPSVA
jgi:hypothetical protein